MENEGSQRLPPGRLPSLPFRGGLFLSYFRWPGQALGMRRTASIACSCRSTSRRNAKGLSASFSACSCAWIAALTSAQASTRSNGVCVGRHITGRPASAQYGDRPQQQEREAQIETARINASLNSCSEQAAHIYGLDQRQSETDSFPWPLQSQPRPSLSRLPPLPAMTRCYRTNWTR